MDEEALQLRILRLALLQEEHVGIGVFPCYDREVFESRTVQSYQQCPGGAWQPAASTIIAKLRFHHSRSFGCQLNLVGVVLFVPLLRSSARHIRAPVAEENLRNSPAAIGSSY